MVDGNAEDPTTAYALCFKCHDQASILGDQSFSEHSTHIVGANTPCSVCHDPHGIPVTQGTAANNSHLINFDTAVVFPVAEPGSPKFEDLDPVGGSFTGRCYLVCHGRDHSGEVYP
jgi:hypothetical protein